MKYINKRSFKFLIIFIFLIILFFVAHNMTRLYEYSPTKINNKAGPIVIKFKQPVNPNEGEYTIEPKVNNKLQIIDNYIIIWPEEGLGFDNEKTYSASFHKFRTVSGKDIPNIKIKFTVNKDWGYSKLQEYVLSKYGHFESSDDSFINKLPYQKDFEFKISASIDYNNTKYYTILIETLVMPGKNNTQDEYIKEVKDARNKALGWIQQQGVDIKKNSILFSPNDETLYNPHQDNNPLITGD